ncbi:MAG TPA: PadR family transcriptional regulator [Gemmatimonadaceae bacterium]|nr:PadR family transcriptional regulator [Gemmatimonadaceae bacterium]
MGRRPGYATLAVLHALSRGARYGLDIIDRTGLPSGTVYPILSRLERDGHVNARWEETRTATAEGRPRRRYYRLTRTGTAAAARIVREWQALMAPDGARRARS